MQAQAVAAQRRLAATAGSTATLSGLPAITNAAATGQARLAQATAATSATQATLSATSTRLGNQTRQLAREFQQAETSAGRFTRGTVAATAASTGLFRAVSFASGAFLVGALAGGAIGAAVQEFQQMTVVGAQTAAVLRATGGVANVTAEQIDELGKSQLRLTGTDDELVKRAANVLLTFRAIRNESGAMNDIFTRSVKAVQDISSVFGTDLVGSAVQLGKALQDPVRGVTALRRSGITLSQSQRDLIKSLVESGRILSAQKIILGEVERQVGGTAEAIGSTLPGRLAIMRESAKNALGEYVKRISESRKATELFRSVMTELGQTFSALRKIVVGIVSPLAAVTGALNRFLHLTQAFQSLGGLSSILLAGVAFKSVTVAIGLATRAQILYARATTASTVATGAQTAALSRLAVAAGTSTAAVGASTAAAGGLGTALSKIGTGNLIALGVAGLALTFIQMRKAARDAIDPLTGVGHALDNLGTSLQRLNSLRSQRAAAGENTSLARFDQIAAQRAVNAAEAALAATTAEPGAVQQLALADDLTRARIKLAAATKALETQEAALRRIDESIRQEQTQQTNRFQAATAEIQKQTAAIRERNQEAQGSARLPGIGGVPLIGPRVLDLIGLGPSGQQKRQEAINDATKLFQNFAASSLPSIANLGKALEAITVSFNKIPTQKQITLATNLAGAGASANTIVRTLLALPQVTQKQVNLVLSLAAQGTNVQEILKILGVAPGREQAIRGLPVPLGEPNTSIQERRKAILAEIKRLQDLLTGGVVKETRGLNEIVAARRQELAVARETVRADREAVQAAQEARQNAIQGLADARRSLADAQRNLIEVIASSHQAITDAIRNSRQAINDAVQSAKENLTSLGDSVAQTLGRFFTALSEGQTQGLTGKLGPQFQRLREQILAGGAGAGTQGRAQRLAAEIAGQKAEKPVVDTDKIQRQFDNLTDAFNRGKISLPQFNKRLDNLLKGVDFNKVTRVLGSAAAHQLRDWVRDLRAQARINAETPQRAITRQLVNPLRAVADGAKELAAARKQASRDIAAARQGIADADRGIGQAVKGLQRANQDLADAQRKLARDQIEEAKKNRAAIIANTKQLKIRNDLDAARAKLNEAQKPKDKGKGAAATSSDTLVGAGAAAP